MPRLVALVSICALAACSSSPQSGGSAGSSGSAAAGSSAGSAPASASAPGPGKPATPAAPAAPAPKTTLEQVQRWAPEGSHVAPVELKIPGLELFAVTDGKAPTEEAGMGKLVAIRGGAGGALLDTRELVQAAIAAKPDTRTLARVALWVAQDDGEILDAAKTREHKKAKVKPPIVARDALTFWVTTTDVPRMLERGVLDLKTGGLSLELQPLPPKVAISNAMTTLDSNHVSRHAVAVRTLAEACQSDPRARMALLGLLASHPRVKTRVAIADDAHRCGAAAIDALIMAMENDRVAVVRSEAARALGRIGNSRARPALAKAVRGEDANLAWAAGNALKKLN